MYIINLTYGLGDHPSKSYCSCKKNEFFNVYINFQIVNSFFDSNLFHPFIQFLIFIYYKVHVKGSLVADAFIVIFCYEFYLNEFKQIPLTHIFKT